MSSSSSPRFAHGLRRLSGRDPRESHRSATPLELLYDLTLVIAFGIAGSQFAHAIAEEHVLPGLVGFLIAVFAVSWSWINFTWFQSAFDTDDWYIRLATLLQMVGVIVVALGLPELTHGLVEGWEVHNGVLVAGYVVMRVGMALLWIRAAAEHPTLRATCLRYARGIIAIQVVWVILAIVHLPGLVMLPLMALLLLLEVLIPALAESKEPTPWHPEHIAERYGLLVIISLGEIILGTSIAVEELIAVQGWSLDAVVVMAAGISLAFALWWVYFALPFHAAIERCHPRPVLAFGYGHIVIFGAIAAVGTGLHVAAYHVSGELHASALASIVSIALPTALVITGLTLIFHAYFAGHRAFHLLLVAIVLGLCAMGVVVVVLGVPLSIGILIVMLAPWTTVIGFETLGHRHVETALRSEA